MEIRVSLNLAEFRRVVEPQALRIMTDYGYETLARMAELFGRPKSGRVYKSPRGPYRASAPGEPPAIRTGRMFRNRRVEPLPPRRVDIVVDTTYARILEGLQRSDRVAPRPFVRPALHMAAERMGLLRDRV